MILIVINRDNTYILQVYQLQPLTFEDQYENCCFKMKLSSESGFDEIQSCEYEEWRKKTHCWECLTSISWLKFVNIPKKCKCFFLQNCTWTPWQRHNNVENAWPDSLSTLWFDKYFINICQKSYKFLILEEVLRRHNVENDLSKSLSTLEIIFNKYTMNIWSIFER